MIIINEFNARRKIMKLRKKKSDTVGKKDSIESGTSSAITVRSNARNKNKAFKPVLIVISSFAVVLGIITLTNPFDVRDKLLAAQIVKLRVAPKRLPNPKNPSDYGMAFKNVDIITADNVRLSAWEIPASADSNKTVIMNHPLLTTRYGSEEGLDGVEAEFLPMVKHLHGAGYNIVMYDHRGQGDSDGGIGSSAIGTETPVGVGVLEWQDVAASLRYVLGHEELGDDEIVFLSQCMGANATFLAWQKEPELFANPQIKGLIANQPTLSYEFSDRYIREKAFGLDLIDDVLDTQIEKYGFGFAEPLKYLPSLTVPVLYAQVEKDIYTFDEETGQNDIVEIMDATPTNHDIVWIGSDQEIPFGTDQRFDAYRYFNTHPVALLDFLSKQTSADDTKDTQL
jgi:pimeloyl-ACP methyl ester carboxylesterase